MHGYIATLIYSDNMLNSYRWPRGSRVIYLREGVQEFKTYVRMEDGSVIDGN